MANLGNQAQIDFIVSQLRKGGKKMTIQANFGKKWPEVSDRTFRRRLYAAEERYSSERNRIQAKAEEKVAEEVEARKLEIMDVMERKDILTQIARGKIPLKKHMVVDKVIEEVDVIPDWNDRRAAIAELNKMDGDYAPTKQSNVNPDGTPVEQVKEQTIIIYRDMPPMKVIES